MNKITIEEGSGNIFADLGFPHPEIHLLKAKLAIQIERVIREKNLTH